MLFYLLDQAADPLELLMETSYTIRWGIGVHV